MNRRDADVEYQARLAASRATMEMLVERMNLPTSERLVASMDDAATVQYETPRGSWLQVGASGGTKEFKGICDYKLSLMSTTVPVSEINGLVRVLIFLATSAGATANEIIEKTSRGKQSFLSARYQFGLENPLGGFITNYLQTAFALERAYFETPRGAKTL